MSLAQSRTATTSRRSACSRTLSRARANLGACMRRNNMNRTLKFVLAVACACALVIATTTIYIPRGDTVASGTAASSVASGTAASSRKLLTAPVGPAGVILNAIIQPTTFLRVALLILRNSVNNNGGMVEEFLQMILTTDLGFTKFTNVFASFASGVIQDFSSGVTTDTVLAQEWVIDGSSTLDNTVFSEFFAGGAFGGEYAMRRCDFDD